MNIIQKVIKVLKRDGAVEVVLRIIRKLVKNSYSFANKQHSAFTLRQAVNRRITLLKNNQQALQAVGSKNVSNIAAHIFVPEYYAKQRGLEHLSDDALFCDFLNYGAFNQYSPNPMYSVEVFKHKALDLGIDVSGSFNEWLEVGVPNMLVPTVLFDCDWYCKEYPSLIDKSWSYIHFICKGLSLNLSPNQYFLSLIHI